jgi:hypothetical protein
VRHNISQGFSPNKLKVPLYSALIFLGVVGFGIVGQQVKPVLSNQIAPGSTATANLIDSHRLTKTTSVLTQLREIQTQRIQPLVKSTIIQTQTVTSTNASPNVKIGLINTSRQLPKATFSAADGIYLYGQSPVANQFGQGYIIFQKQQGKVMGALYVPNSEFSCFQGTVDQSGELALSVTSSPGEGAPIQVSTTSRIPRVIDGEAMTYAYTVELQNYHRLNSPSANDQQILQMCYQNADGVYTRLVK